MSHKLRITLLGVVASVAIAASMDNTAAGAEIHIRPRAQVDAVIVRLGDVAEILSADPREASRLAGIELFPAPAEGNRRIVRSREVIDILVRRGVNFAEHRVFGANRIELTHPVPPRAVARRVPVRPRAPTPMALSAADKNQVHARLKAAIEQRLLAIGQKPPRAKWGVAFALTDAQIRLLRRASGRFTVDGSQAPWVGIQEFHVTFDTDVSSDAVRPRLRIRTKVALLSPTVVATKTIPRGMIVRASDVELKYRDGKGRSHGTFTEMADVVGQETVSVVAAGRPITDRQVRRPLLVRRGEHVTIYAIAPGIRIRTDAKALRDGSLGDLVEVESLDDRRKFRGRVSGPQQLEIFARGAVAAEHAPGIGRTRTQARP